MNIKKLFVWKKSTAFKILVLRLLSISNVLYIFFLVVYVLLCSLKCIVKRLNKLYDKYFVFV